MYIVEDKGGAIALMLAALCFLGTWPAVMTLLERRGRLPQHTYLDYSITNLLAAVIIALTFGEIGSSKHGMPNFFTQLTQALPLLSTFWGICLFGEYRRSSRRTYILLVGMLFMFIVAVAVLMVSAGHRKS